MENNIITDAFYLVRLYNKAGIPITQLHVQKLMFLFEAYYMNMVDGCEKLYECEYQAWDFGPVATQLYKHFKKYGKDNIVLTSEELSECEKISKEKKNLIKDIFDTFKNFTATQLVNFTHAEGSPWKIAWDYEKYSKISKEKMKVWFSQYVVKTK